MTVPNRGDVVIMDFDPQAGHEQMKRWPALVLSPAAFNETFGLAFVAPVTTKPRGHAFEVPLPEGFAVQGSVMLHQVKSLDWRARGARFAVKVPGRILTEAIDIVRDIIDGAE
jgi:mRNA interferase MazF